VRLLVLLGAYLALAPVASANDARIVAERPIEGGVELTIETPAFTAPTHVQVFLPEGYAAGPKRGWPVTYYLHGAQGSDKRFADWYGDLIAGFGSIVVAPDGGPLGFYSDWYNGGAGGPPMYETYDIEQLLPLIDARFETTGTRAGRALIGESMGGYGVMTYATRHPDLFAAATSISGFVDSNFAPAQAIVTAAPLAAGAPPDAIYGPRGSEEVRWRGKNPADLAANLRDVELQVRTSSGVPNLGEETPGPQDCALEQAIYQTNLSFHAQLEDLGIRHEWKDYGPGCHTIPAFRRAFTDSLPGLERVFARPRPDPKVFSYRSIEPRFSIWDWRIVADPARALEFLELVDAGRGGVTLVGSGSTGVTTPPFFARLRKVDVVSDGDVRVVRPTRAGRLRLAVDLGPAHSDPQFSRATDDFTRRTLRLEPYARLVLSGRPTRSGVRACLRSVGPAVRRTRIVVLADGDRVARSRPLAVAGSARCVRLSVPRAGSLSLRAASVDRFGHRLTATRRVR
jgi:S-formylglutathione hydrolase FrmB